MVPSAGTAPSATTTIENEPAGGVTPLQMRRDAVDVERLLGDEDRVGAAGDAGVRGDPAGVAAHDLQQHDSVVALGGAVQPVNGLGRDLQGGREPDRELGAAQVVVDRLRDTDDRCTPSAASGGCRCQRPLTADDDETVELMRVEHLTDPVEATALSRDAGSLGSCPASCRRGAGSPSSRPASERPRTRSRSIIPSKPLRKPTTSMLWASSRTADHGADHCVQPGAVAAPRQNANTSDHCADPSGLPPRLPRRWKGHA